MGVTVLHDMHTLSSCDQQCVLMVFTLIRLNFRFCFIVLLFIFENKFRYGIVSLFSSLNKL